MLKYRVKYKDGSEKILGIKDYNQFVPKFNAMLNSGEVVDYEVL